MAREIAKLQYITRGAQTQEILSEVRAFIAGGGKWVQLRMKEALYDHYLECAIMVAQLCKEHQVTLIINDNPHIAKECGADGVHIGKSDMSVEQVRAIVGLDMIVGRTANTFEDIEQLTDAQIDYIGLGPYKWTSTKKNIASLLGIEGYQDISREIVSRGIPISPIVAIGSVGVDDIEPLSAVESLWGVAVSAEIGEAKDPSQTTRKLLELIDKNFKI